LSPAELAVQSAVISAEAEQVVGAAELEEETEQAVAAVLPVAEGD
jgi:hypothetical protein